MRLISFKPLGVAWSSSLVALTLVISGCVAESVDATNLNPTDVSPSTLAFTFAGVVIPNPPENSNHNYLLDDDRIPTIATCEDWATFWRGYGPAISFQAADLYGEFLSIAVSTQIYLKNQHLDGNADGVICLEEESADVSEALLAKRFETQIALSPETSLLDPQECQLRNYVQDSVGFPLKAEYKFSEGSLRVKVLYFDSAENESSVEPEADFEALQSRAGSFLEAMSYERVRYLWDVEPTVFRLDEQTLDSLNFGQKSFAAQAIRSADPFVDFTSVDFVVLVFPESMANAGVQQFWVEPMSKASGIITDEGIIYRATWLAVNTADYNNAFIFAHELGHLLGIQDYYWHQWTQNDPYEDQFKFMGAFDNMNFATGPAKEWTGWTRWLLGYLDDSQVRCIAGESESTHQIVSIANSQARTKLAVIPVSSRLAIVIESRRSEGYDFELTKASEGSLVYVVDTAIVNGQGPLRLARSEGQSMEFLMDAPLLEGETLELLGFEITNLSSTPDFDVVQISPLGS